MRRSQTPTPLGAIGRGVAAGVAGTAAMTIYQTAVAKLRGTEPKPDMAQGQRSGVRPAHPS